MAQNMPLNTGRLDKAFFIALEHAWCRETCWQGCRDQYSEDNPAWGNCLVSTLAAWAARGFGDEVMPGLALHLGQATWHFRLMARGMPIDPTWQQFEAGTYFQPLPRGIPMHGVVVAGSLFNAQENAQLRQRLGLLIRRMADRGYDLGHDAEFIVDQAEQRFAYARVPFPGSPSP